MLELINPLVGGTYTDRFGPRGYVPGVGDAGFHTGLDIVAPENTMVQPCAPGVIARVWWDKFVNGGPAGGHMVEVVHDSSYSTRYAHGLERCYFDVGTTVGIDAALFPIGMSGAANGIHCHLELLNSDGVYLDPEPYMRERLVSNPLAPKSEENTMVYVTKTTGGKTEWALIIGTNATIATNQDDANGLSAASRLTAQKVSAYVYNALVKNCKRVKVR